MCGIAGWIGRGPGEALGWTLAEAMSHRGPDAARVEGFLGGCLISTRLSVIDISDAGTQPFSDPRSRVSAVCNGEIYNHWRLRRELGSDAGGIRSTCDVAILPALYNRYGRKCVRHLRGMFALAVHDPAHGCLLLARDRFGIKPLYYAVARTHESELLCFASELNALRLVPGIDLRPNEQAIHDLMGLGYVPGPETFYRGIRSLGPGESLLAHMVEDRVRFRIEPFHTWAVTPDPQLHLAGAAEVFAEHLRSAVDRQLESDVPLGLAVSGGLDSSLIAAAAMRTSRGALPSFHVRFPTDAFDESWAAEAVARHVGTSHTVVDLPSGGCTYEEVTSALRSVGQPFGDSSLFAMRALSRAVSGSVKVLLTGDGGDEAFSGYFIFRRAERLARLHVLPRALRGALAGVCGRTPWWPGDRERAAFAGDATAVVENLHRAIGPDEHRRVCRGLNALPLRRLFEPRWEYRWERGPSTTERIAATVTEAATRVCLADNFLRKVDAGSMAYSVEARVPMLDEDLFAFGLTLSHQVKVADRGLKGVMREAAGAALPPAVSNKTKWGFAVPAFEWVPPNVRLDISTTILGSRTLGDVLDRSVYADWVHDFSSGDGRRAGGDGELFDRILVLASLAEALDG